MKPIQDFKVMQQAGSPPDFGKIQENIQEQFQGPQAQLIQFQIPLSHDESFMPPPSEKSASKMHRLDSFRIDGESNQNLVVHQANYDNLIVSMHKKSSEDLHDDQNDIYNKNLPRTRTQEMGSTFTINKTDNLLSTFLRLVMAKSYQTNFVQNLMNKSYIKRLRHLTNYQKNILDDLLQGEDSYDEDHDNQNCSSIFFKCLKRITKTCSSFSYDKNDTQIPVLEPVSSFMVFWDLFQIIIILLIFLWIPFKLSFEFNYIINLFQTTQNEFLIEEIILSILTCDVLIGCNLAFINKGIIERQRSKIILNYLQKNAFGDVVHHLNYIVVLFDFSIFFLQLSDFRIKQQSLALIDIWFKFLHFKSNKNGKNYQKTLRVFDVINFRFFNLNGSLNDMMSLVKVLVLVILIGHLCACAWHAVAYYAADDQLTWINFYKYDGSDSPTRYNASFYWAIMTMTTVGYGDIVAQNNFERVVSTVTMFLSCAVFAFSINTIGIVLQNLYKSTMEYSKTVSVINNFMHKNKIPLILQTRIRSYLEYVWREEQDMNDDEVTAVVGKLSSHLQEELQHEIRGSVLQQSKVISQNFSEGFQKKVMNIMEEVRFSPEEQIITINVVDDNALYMITQGEIEITFEAIAPLGDRFKKNILKTISKGDVFGEISFFTEQARCASAFSKGFSKVFKIKRDSFMHILLQFPEDFEKFQYVRDSALQYSDFTQLKMRCYSCKRASHLLQYCHMVHYKPDHERIHKKENYPHFNDRLFKKRSIGKINTRSSAQLVYSRAKDFQAEILNELQALKNKDYDGNSSHSSLGPIQEAYEDGGEFEDGEKLDSEINSVLKSAVDYRNTNRSLSKISQISQKQVKLEVNDELSAQPDDFNNFFRNTAIKLTVQTVQTAGFGMGESLKMKHQTTLAKDIVDESEEWSEDISQQSKSIASYNNQSNSQNSVPLITPPQVNYLIPQIPVANNQNQQQAKNWVAFQKPKLTRKNSDTQIVEPYSRQISNRSQTYTTKIQQNLQIQQNSQNFLKSEQDVTESQDIYKRSIMKRRSSKANTHMTYNRAESSMNDNTIIQRQPQALLDFDKMELFETYFTLNNYDNVLRRLVKLQRFFGKKRLFKETSNYSFYFVAIKKGARLRRNLENPQILADIKKANNSTVQQSRQKQLLSTMRNFSRNLAKGSITDPKLQPRTSLMKRSHVIDETK